MGNFHFNFHSFPPLRWSDNFLLICSLHLRIELVPGANNDVSDDDGESTRIFSARHRRKTLSRQLRVEGKSLGNVENVWIILKTFSILLRLRCHGPFVTLVCFWI